MSEHKAVQNMQNMVQYWTSIQPVQKSKRSLPTTEKQSTGVRRKVKIKRSVPNIRDASHTTASDCSKS